MPHTFPLNLFISFIKPALEPNLGCLVRQSSQNNTYCLESRSTALRGHVF